MALKSTFSWKYCQLDVVVRRCSDSVSDHLGHVKVTFVTLVGARGSVATGPRVL